MATPQDKLPDLSDLADPPVGKVARPRAPSLRVPAPPAPVAGGLPDLSDLAEPPPARAPRASRAPRAARSYGAHEVFQPDGADWSIERAAPVKQFFRDTFKRDLPVSAFGQSPTHEARRLDHRRSMDVKVNPTTPEGKRLAEYFRANNIPFLAYNHAVPGAATGAHFHVGVPSRGFGAGPTTPAPGAASLPDLSDLAETDEAHDELAGELLIRTRFDAATPDVLRRRGTREEIAEFNSSMLPHLDALGVRRVEFEDNEAGGAAAPAGLPDLSQFADAPDDEVERVNSVPGSVAAAPAPSTLPPPDGLNPYSSEDRERRDMAAAARVRAVTVPLSRSLADYGDDSELMAAAYREGARALNIDSEFIEEWLKSHPDDLRLINSATGERHKPVDLLGSGVHDERQGTVRLNLGGLSDMQRDYAAQRSTAARVVDWATDDTRTAGEKFLDVGAPVAGAAGDGLEKAGDVLSTPSTLFWSLARKRSPSQAVADAWHQLSTGETPKGAENWLAEKTKRDGAFYPIWMGGESVPFAEVKPNLPALAGGVVEMVTDPGNLIPLGLAARGARLLRGVPLVREVETALKASSDARALKFFKAGGRILRIEAAPFDELATAADDVPHFKMTLKDADGNTHEIDTSAYYEGGQKPKLKTVPADREITGQGLEVDGASRRVYFHGQPQDFKLEADGLVASPVGGRSAQPSTAEWQPFPADSGSLNVPRSSMPQIEGRHRGALVNYLKGRGITHEQVEIAPNSLKPSQAEFSPAKVEKARGFTGKERSILVSSDGHVIDGHHQWLSKLDDAPDVPIPAIRLNAPAHQVLIETARFPSSGVDAASAAGAGGGRAASAALPDLSDLADEPLTAAPVAGAESRADAVRRAARNAQDVVNLAKAIPASFDNSALFGQGAIISGARPSLIPGAIADSARSAMSRTKFEAFKKKLVTHPNQDLRESSGLYLASIKQGEETFGSRFADKISGVAASQRAYEATLDSLRSNAFDLYSMQLAKAGVTDPKAYKDMARWVNVATGRGELGRLEPLAAVLNLPLFSPRLLASKFNVISPLRYKNMHPAARKIALREMFRATGSLSVTMGLAKLAGADVDLDPFSPGFGTIQHGQTSYDLSGGRLRPLRYAAQIMDSLNRKRRGEKVKDDRKPAVLVEKFFRAYLSPVGQLAADYYTGEDFNGQEFGTKEWKPSKMKFGELDRLMPFAVKEMRDAYHAAGVIGAVKAAPTFAGVGVKTKAKLYPDPIKPALSEPVRGELDRLGLDLEHLEKDGKRSAAINPNYKTEDVTGDSSRVFGGVVGKPGRQQEGMGVDAEKIAKDFSAELNQVLTEVINSPDYESFEDDEARARYIEMLILNTHERHMSGVRFDARGEQMERAKGVQRRLDRMSGGSAKPIVKNFKL